MIMSLRKSAHVAAGERHAFDEWASEPGLEVEPAQSRADCRVDLRRAIRVLPRRQREALAYFVIDGMKERGLRSSWTPE